MEHPQYELIDGVLYNENPAAVLHAGVLQEAHGGRFVGHFSEVYETLRWKGMRADVRRHCRSCFTGKTVHKYGLNGNTVRVRRTEDRRSQTDADLHGIRLRSP